MAEFNNSRKKELDTEFKLAFSRQGAPTSPQTPNQIGEMGRLLNSGMKNVEVGAIQADVFETIPAQHLKEMKRMAKLTESNISVHAPIIDLAGFNQQGKWSEDEREQNEAHMKGIVDRSHNLDPNGNIPITLHAGIGVPGSITKKDKQGKEYKQLMYAVDKENGGLVPLKHEILEYLGKTKEWTPEERLDVLNYSSWEQEKLQLMSYQKAKQELEHMNKRIVDDPKFLELNMAAQNEAKGYGKLSDEEKQELTILGQRMESNNRQINEYDSHLQIGLNNLHNKCVKYRGDPENDREKFEYEVADKKLKKVREDYLKFNKNFEKEAEKFYKKRERNDISEEEYARKITNLRLKQSEIHDSIMLDLGRLPTPHYYIPAEDFAREKTKETVANAALYAYKKYGKKSPIISIENFMPTTVLSRAEDLKKLVKESRKEAAKKIAKEKGISEKEAGKITEKIIGATWDVGHIHQLKKQGFKDKDLLKETEKIAPFVKHVHLTDNFGYADSHLPLGMGDVPIKQHLKELEKDAAEGRRHIVECGAFPQHFKQSPTPQTLEYLESPVYSYSAGPSWAEARDMYASYLVGYGDILPEKHFDTFFGGGFSRLPKELGGQGQGNKSQFSGTPNQ